MDVLAPFAGMADQGAEGRVLGESFARRLKLGPNTIDPIKVTVELPLKGPDYDHDGDVDINDLSLQGQVLVHLNHLQGPSIEVREADLFAPAAPNAAHNASPAWDVLELVHIPVLHPLSLGFPGVGSAGHPGES